MSQWFYFSLRLTAQGLFGYQYQTDTFTPVHIPPDILIDQNNPAITLCLWAAYMGQLGWELVNILTDEQGQEWVFKAPTPIAT